VNTSPLTISLFNTLGLDSPEKSSASLTSLNQKAILTEKIETRNKIDVFENAFRKIKEATGVSGDDVSVDSS
jgi:hypothetical protein